MSPIPCACETKYFTTCLRQHRLHQNTTYNSTSSRRCVCFRLFGHIWSRRHLDVRHFDRVLPNILESPTTHPIQFKLSSVNVLWWQKLTRSSVLTYLVSLWLVTFDLLISQSNQLIFVPKCIRVVNLVKFLKGVYKISRSETSGRTDGITNAQTTRRQCICSTGLTIVYTHKDNKTIETVPRSLQ